MARPKTTERPDVSWPDLLETALTLPGALGNTYSRFYNYSFMNMVTLAQQGVEEPVASFKKWNELGRWVKRGSKAKMVWAPIKFTVINEDGTKHQVLRGFRPSNTVFALSDTSGDDIPEVKPRGWDRSRALGALAVTEEPFRSSDGNSQGYSYGNKLAINPMAKYPIKTTLHELGHIVIGHTVPDKLAEYQTHRGIYEFQAESTAYLGMHELELSEEMDTSESRAYIQGWLRGQVPEASQIRPVFTAVDKILRAGRESEQ